MSTDILYVFIKRYCKSIDILYAFMEIYCMSIDIFCMSIDILYAFIEIYCMSKRTLTAREIVNHSMVMRYYRVIV